jgi:transposase
LWSWSATVSTTAVFVAEIVDVGRFDNPRRLCSWAGLTPRLREPDTHTHRGHITKMGSRPDQMHV